MIDAIHPGTRLKVGHVATGLGDAWSVEWNTRTNCSLTPRQLLAGYGVVCAFSLAVACFFWAQGVRLILPFAGLELAGIAVALLVHARHVGDAERIALHGGQLTIDRDVAGTHEHLAFDAGRVRVERPDGAQALVPVTAPGRRLVVGRHLQPHLRRQLADELRWALRVAR